jgi:folate-binding protein YgfZ
MLSGVLTGAIPAAPETPPGGAGAGPSDVAAGAGTYHAVLTPKGKMIADLWCYHRGDADHEEYLLDVPVAARPGLLEHFGKFLPPRLARVDDVTESTASISVAGPEAAAHLARLALGLRVEAGDLAGLAEGAWRAAGSEGPGGLMVARTEEVWPEAYTVYGPADAVAALWRALVAAGATPAGLGVWATLRVEAARPAYGTDMDENTIPVEAGIHDRAIDYAKGCYTGQEVIVRIRDRGHVNRSLRQLMLGDVPAPHRGAELFVDGSDTPVGRITSAVQSPRFGQTVALAYVKRGVEGEVRPR